MQLPRREQPKKENDRDDLPRSLVLAQTFGRQDLPARARHQTQTSDQKFPADHRRRRPGWDRAHRHKRNKRGRHHDLVDQRIHELSKIRHDAVAARDFAVHEIRYAGDDKNNESDGAGVAPGAVEHGHEDHGQHEAADGKTVCPVHACTGDPVSLKTARFQIGTTRFNSSMIHWLAPTAAPRWPLAPRTTTDGSPPATNPIRCRKRISRTPNFTAALSATSRI